MGCEKWDAKSEAREKWSEKNGSRKVRQKEKWGEKSGAKRKMRQKKNEARKVGGEK